MAPARTGHHGPHGDLYVIDILDLPANRERNYPDNFIATSKYTLLSFLPLNLFEQFQRFSNIYFATAAGISLIPGVSPIPPVTQISPLIFVLFVAGVKDWLEDRQRHRADKAANETPYDLLRKDGGRLSVRSDEICVGDVVVVRNKELFPSDLLLLASSGEEGTAFVETSNLDGETNLKRRKAVAATAHCVTDADVLALAGSVDCDRPNADLHQFKGVLKQEGAEPLALTPDNLLLRGSQLRNTRHVYGLVLYAGVDTKLFRNLQSTPARFSKLETRLNRVVAGVFVIYFALLGVSSAYARAFQAEFGLSLAWYLPVNGTDPDELFVTSIFTYFVLYSYMLPISLFVTIEFVRVAQAAFMEWDHRMHGMKAKNSRVNEELGQIEHIFSDKTGTLTRNIMELSKWSTGGRVFHEIDDPGSLKRARTSSSADDLLVRESTDLLRCLTICHTVVPERDEATGEVVYQAQSPDEAALVYAAANNGVVLKHGHGSTNVIEVDGQTENHDVLAVLEFTPERKRMSVIARGPDGKITLWVKGADANVLPLMEPGQEQHIDAVESQLVDFAKLGLRTLIIGKVDIDEDVWTDFAPKLKAAENDLSDNRRQALSDVYDLIEKNVRLVGCTAVEDKLQENCAETIDFLLKGGIHLWVLTGDKQETAINIGYSSKILTQGQNLMICSGDETITSAEVHSILDQHLKNGMSVKEKGGSNALVINGFALAHALKDHTRLLLDVGLLCSSVICCRVTPLQKALMVREAKVTLGRIVLAVGDGANDVSMIQEANVGVGIEGLEGTQAARASDFSIKQFQHLMPLLAIHGRYSYLRFAGLIQYSFYKNLAYILPHLWYGAYSGWSGTTIYDALLLTMFNIVFTSTPPLFYGIFEKDVDEQVLLDNPQLYRRLWQDCYLNMRTAAGWVWRIALHSTVFWQVWSRLFLYGAVFADGRTGGLWTFGLISSTIGVTTVTLRMAMFIKYWTWLTHFAIWVSIALWFAFSAWYSTVAFVTGDIFGVWPLVMTSPVFWAGLCLVLACTLGPDAAWMYWQRQTHPTDVQVLQEAHLLRKKKMVVSPSPSH